MGNAQDTAEYLCPDARQQRALLTLISTVSLIFMIAVSSSTMIYPVTGRTEIATCSAAQKNTNSSLAGPRYTGLYWLMRPETKTPREVGTTTGLLSVSTSCVLSTSVGPRGDCAGCLS